MDQDKSKQDKPGRYFKFLSRYRALSNENIPVKKSSGIEKKNIYWGLLITVVSFSLSIMILFVSTSIFGIISPELSILVVFAIILLGVASDILGIAVTAADEIPFHSMAAKKIPGASQSIMLLRNASRVSSFCNDVVGDICSVVSGAAGTAIVYRVFSDSSKVSFIEVTVGAFIAALTVGGKGFTKNIGMNNANYIVYKVGRLLSIFSRTGKGKKSKERKNS